MLSRGWLVVAESFGARLDLSRSDPGFDQNDRIQALRATAASLGALGLVAVELDVTWSTRVMALDALTAADYPSDSPATSHASLDEEQARDLWSNGRVYGVVGLDEPESLFAITAVRCEGDGVVETEFTAVVAGLRGRGIGAAVKAASVLQEWERGAREFRTGGSCSNAAIRASNARLGYVETERWLTVRAPTRV
jgi:predicted GNAT family acetyltransferase